MTGRLLWDIMFPEETEIWFLRQSFCVRSGQINDVWEEEDFVDCLGDLWQNGHKEGKWMINTVIFDLDGLLIDSEKISYQLYRDLLKMYGHGFTVEEYAGDYSGKTGVGNMTSLIERFELPIELEEGLAWVREREKVYLSVGVDLKDGVKELLEYLRGNKYHMVLATSSTKDRALGVLKSHYIKHYFEKMVFGTDIERGKPNPDIFLKALEKVGKTPEESLVLEDSEAGIQAAYGAHIPVICIPDMKRPGKEYEDMTAAVLNSLYQVMDYLEGRSAGKEI